MSELPAPFTTTAPASPSLAERPVRQLLELFGEELPWLSHRYSLVQTATRRNGTKTERTPQIYQQDGSKYHFDVLPDESMGAMCFFERNGPSVVVWDDGAMQIAGTWRHPLSAVFWCNLPAIDNRPDDFSGQLATDVMRVLVEAGIPVSSVEQRAEEVFRRYTLEDKKLLMWPYAGFKIALTLPECWDPCTEPFTVVNGPVQHPTPGDEEEVV